MVCMFYFARCIIIIFNSLLAQHIKYNVHTICKIKFIHAICYHIFHWCSSFYMSHRSLHNSVSKRLPVAQKIKSLCVDDWFYSYLSGRIQLLKQTQTTFISLYDVFMQCWQCSVLAPVLFIACVCLTHQLTDWLLQYQVPSVCWRHSAACHSGLS